jgi:hypothetical protein
MQLCFLIWLIQLNQIKSVDRIWILRLHFIPSHPMNILFALFSENMNYYFLYIFIWPFYSNIFANGWFIHFFYSIFLLHFPDVIMFPSYKNIFLHNHRQFQSKERIKRPLMENQMNFAPSNSLLYGENNKRRKLESNSELPFEVS